MEKIRGWMVKKKSVWIAGTEFYVISYAGLVFGNNIIYSISSGLCFGKNVSLNGPVLSPNKHSQDLLLPLDVMVMTEKDSVINGKDQGLIIAVSFMFIHFQLSDDSLFF